MAKKSKYTNNAALVAGLVSPETAHAAANRSAGEPDQGREATAAAVDQTAPEAIQQAIPAADPEKITEEQPTAAANQSAQQKPKSKGSRPKQTKPDELQAVPQRNKGGRPKKAPEERSTNRRINCTMTKEAAEAIEHIAQLRNMSASEIVAQAVGAYLKQPESQKTLKVYEELRRLLDQSKGE